MMDRQKIFTYVKQKYGTAPDYPWFDTSAVLRHKDTRKWYGLVMEVQREKLKLTEGSMTDVIDVLNVKCDPMLVSSLRMQDGFHPAYHMNKERWITIRLDDSVPEATIRNLIDLSYELTMVKLSALPMKSKERISGNPNRQSGGLGGGLADKIITELKENPKVTQKELADNIDVPLRSIQRILKDMRDCAQRR